MFEAMRGWLGPRRGRTLLLVLVVLTPIGYALSFTVYPVRVGWANFMIAAQLLVVAQATLWPGTALGGPWRWAVFGSALTMAGFTAARGVLGAFLTDLYPTFWTPHPVNVGATVATNVTLVLSSVAVLVAWRGEAESQLRDQAFSDSLSGLTNRKGWDELAKAAFDQARRHTYPLALLMVDLDHFKRINDTQGHDVGDQVLRMFGKLIRDNQRGGDVVARIGGEEFALLLPQTDQAGALLFEQRLRQSLAEACHQQPQLNVNYSAGLSLLLPADVSLTTLMLRADSALYRAKDRGRGRIEIET
jgi:diguanylate cyclase (GGDEF)-like protein